MSAHSTHAEPAWSHVRLATGVALSAWAAAFWFIIATDRLSFYLASRTTWLAPVGAVTLTLAAMGRLASARSREREPLERPHLTNLAILVAPALALVLVPPATLGAFAVERRTTTNSTTTYGSTFGVDLTKEDLSLGDVFGLAYTGDFGKLASRAGTTSSFTGFVSRGPGDAATEFLLNRFLISCCPGDAVNVQVRIVGAPPGQFKPDDWVRVTGQIYPIGKQLVVDASEVRSVPRPKHPYLTPR